jgi:hypothetical protein
LTPKLNDSDTFLPEYSFSVMPRIVTGEGAEQSIHFENLRLTINVMNGRGLSISTAVDVKKGQQIVVGKATVQDRAVILVLSAKILD